MSHSYTAKNGTIFHYNSDLSGEVKIIVDAPETMAKWRSHDIPGADLLEFVAEHIRMEKISQIEEMTTEELLGINNISK